MTASFFRSFLPLLMLTAAPLARAEDAPSPAPAAGADDAALAKLLDRPKAGAPLFVRFRIEIGPGGEQWIDYTFSAEADGRYTGDLAASTNKGLLLAYRKLDYWLVRKDGAAFHLDGAALLRNRGRALTAAAGAETGAAVVEAVVSALAREYHPVFVVDVLPAGPREDMFRMGSYFLPPVEGELLRLLEEGRRYGGARIEETPGGIVLRHSKYEMTLDPATGWPVEGFLRGSDGRPRHRFRRSDWSVDPAEVKKKAPAVDEAAAKPVDGDDAPPELIPYRDLLFVAFDRRMLTSLAERAGREGKTGEASFSGALERLAAARMQRVVDGLGLLATIGPRLDDEIRRTRFLVREQAWRADDLRAKVRARWETDERARREEIRTQFEAMAKIFEEDVDAAGASWPPDRRPEARRLARGAVEQFLAKSVDGPIHAIYEERRKTLEGIR